MAPAELIPTLAVVTAAAALAPVVAAFVPGRIFPVIVAEILLGIAAGPSALGLIEPNAVLAVLGALGFAMLMFVSGMEIDLNILLPGRTDAHAGPRRPIAWSLAIVLGTFALSLLGAYLIFGDTRPFAHVLFLALVLSTTSVGIVVPTLKERGLTAGPYGQILLAASIMADFLTMLFVSILAAGITGEDAHAGRPVLFVVLAALAGAAMLRLGKREHVRRCFARLDTATSRLPLRAGFALVFLLALLAEHLGAELVLAAFLAGIIVGGLIPRGAPSSSRIEAMGFGFLIPMFFFSVGVGFDLPALLSSHATLLAMPALIALAYANKILPLLPLRRYFSWGNVLGAGMLMSARLSLIIAASAIGVRVGVLDAALNSAMILLALFTAIVSPVLFNLIAARSSMS